METEMEGGSRSKGEEGRQSARVSREGFTARSEGERERAAQRSHSKVRDGEAKDAAGQRQKKKDKEKMLRMLRAARDGEEAAAGCC